MTGKDLYATTGQLEIWPVRAAITKLTEQAGQKMTIPLPESIGPAESRMRTWKLRIDRHRRRRQSDTFVQPIFKPDPPREK